MTAEIDLDRVKGFQPNDAGSDFRFARARKPGDRIYCFACESTYPSIEAYWERDDCRNLGEAYGCGPT